MKIIDEQGVELTTTPDLSLGRLEITTQIIHHDAVAAVEEVSHYVTIAEYPNGGKDVKRVIDVPGVEARDAYDEEVEVQVYHPYTAAELAAQEEARKRAEQAAKLPTIEDRIAALEAGLIELAAQEV